MTTFEALGVKPWLVDALQRLSIKTPTEIQINCIPQILAGKDCIGSAQTGSGKTAAFALPILQKLGNDPYGVYCLILTPTRELAFQIAEQFRVLGHSINLKQSVIVGGLDITTQALELSQKPHVIVATPGRLVDHIRSSSNSIHFKRLAFLVMDEADRLLDDSFADDLEIILDSLPKQRQTLLFSATTTPSIEELESEKTFKYTCTSRFHTNEKLTQQYIFIPSSVREVYLSFLLKTLFEDKTVIIFASRPRTCEILRLMLREQGLRSTSLHSHMSQNERLGSLAKFKGGIVPILISTDVSSRGLDIPAVQVVLNYELPADPTDYIHRIGRTARAGRSGLSLSFITERDLEIIESIELKIGKKMVELDLVENDVLELLDEVNMAKRTASNELVDKDFGGKQKIQKEKRIISGEEPARKIARIKTK